MPARASTQRAARTRHLPPPERQAGTQAMQQRQQQALALAATQERATGHLYFVLALLTLANLGDLVLSDVLIRAGGLAVEINPVMHALLLWGNLPAFVVGKFVAAVLAALVALACWQYLRPATRFERRVLLGFTWVAAGYMLALDLFLAGQVALLHHAVPALPTLPH